jgi:hypothetical protein
MTARTRFAAFTGAGWTQQNQQSLFFHQNQGAGSPTHWVAGTTAKHAAAPSGLRAF